MKRSLGQSRGNCMKLIVEEERIFKICVKLRCMLNDWKI